MAAHARTRSLLWQQISDDNSSTTKKLQEEYGDVDKQSDIGHTKSSLGAKLRDTKTRNRQCKQLTQPVIQYVEKMFSYALRNNKNDTNGLRKALLSVIPHACGDHSTCSETWCGYLKDPATYKHASLPYGKDLTCEETRRSIRWPCSPL